jgi:hypothetical protein
LSVEHQVRVAPRARALLLVGIGAMASTNYSDINAVGPELSLLVRVPVMDGGLHAGLSLAFHQALEAPGAIDHRAYPVYLEVAWRPLITTDFGVHIGAAGGVVLSDEFDVDTRTVHAAIVGQAVLGVAYRLGPGFIELDGRAGWAQPVSSGLIPLGASASLGYRFGI